MKAEPDRIADSSTWVTVARHRKRRRHGGVDAPWGIYHLLREGTLLTACGQPSATWFRFKDCPFSWTDEQACTACRAVLMGERTSHQ